jgi:anti-sigma-K factor RskA
VNIELYIQSGIVESYVLGLATSTEREEFDQLMPHYAELKAALSDFEYQLELFAIDNEEPPPPEVRERIQARIRDIPAVRPSKNANGRRHERKGSGYLHVETSSNHIRVHKAWRTLFIVIFILSKIFLVLAIYFFLEYRHVKAAVQAPPPQEQVK